jgi:hypothetical protein
MPDDPESSLPKARRYPWLRCRGIWPLLGILCLFLAAWPVSYHFFSWSSARCVVHTHYLGVGLSVADGHLRFWIGRPYQGLFGGAYTGLEFDHSPATLWTRVNQNTYPFSWEWEAADRLAISFHFWLFISIYVAAATAGLLWWERRKRIKSVR